jgi:uncharacterized protein
MATLPMVASPFDTAAHSRSLVQISSPLAKRWRPSQFNARAIASDSNMLLWNTRSGAFSVIPAVRRLQTEQMLKKNGFAGELDTLGQYLLKRGYLVPAEESELDSVLLQMYQQHFREDGLELILLSSEDCNFRCRYCYEDFPRGTMLKSVRDNLKTYVERAAPRLRHLAISWFGGEPLYGWEAVEDLAPFMNDLAEKHGLSYGSSMTTNGYLLTPEKARALFSWNMRKFQLTVDGLADQHNKSRPGRDGSATWDTIMHNLLSLHEMPDPFFINLRLNVDLENAPHLREYIDFLAATFEGDERFVLAIKNVGNWGGSNDSNLTIQSSKQASATQEQVEAYSEQCGISHSTILDSNSFGAGACYAARPRSFIVGANGNIMKCTIVLDKDKYNVVGTLEDGGIMKIDETLHKKWIEPSFALDPDCQTCHLLPSCQGISCPLIRHNTGKRPCAATVKSRIQAEMLGAYRQKKRVASKTASRIDTHASS